MNRELKEHRLMEIMMELGPNDRATLGHGMAMYGIQCDGPADFMRKLDEDSFELFYQDVMANWGDDTNPASVI